MNSYEISTEYDALRALMQDEIDEETGEFIDNSEALNALLEEISLKRDDKLKGLEYIKREYQAMIDSIANETKRLKERKEKFDRKIEQLKSFQELLLNGEKVETDLFTFSFRKSTSVNVDNVLLANLKNKFRTEKTTYSINKADVKKAILSGEEVEGAFLEDKYNLQVK